MMLIKPLAITDAVLTASNIAETDYAAWNSGTTYALGGYCIKNHRIWRSVQASNTNHDPATDDGTWWINERATNRWRMFDGRIADPATNATTISVTLTPGEIVDAIALFGLDAAELEVTVTDPLEGEVYNQVSSLVDDSLVADWYGYFFEPVVRKTEASLLDLPPYIGADIDVLLTVPSGNASVGEVVIGKRRTVGDTLIGVGLGIESYSHKEQDDFGNWYIVPRAYSDTVDFPLSLGNGQISAVRRLLASYIDTPVAAVGKTLDDPWGTLVYGYITDFSIVIPSNVISDCNVKLEGLT
jgi:hypothetical protein